MEYIKNNINLIKCHIKEALRHFTAKSSTK